MPDGLISRNLVVKIIAGGAYPTSSWTAYSNVIRIPGSSMIGDPTSFSISLFSTDDVPDYRSWYGAFIAWLRIQNIITTWYDYTQSTCIVDYVDPAGKYVLCHPMAQLVDPRGLKSNSVSVPYYLYSTQHLDPLPRRQFSQ
jgi:hypothetical protein